MAVRARPMPMSCRRCVELKCAVLPGYEPVSDMSLAHPSRPVNFYRRSGSEIMRTGSCTRERRMRV
eukprot:2287841-Prymnesium_polylepis.1